MKIYKYPINYYSVPEIIRLPIGAKVLCAGIQENNDPKTVLWALVDEGAKKEERIFMLAFTGKEIEGKIENTYNTLFFPNGIVGHLLEVSGVKGNDPEKDERLKK